MTDYPPPTQFDSVEDGLVVRTTAEKVRRYSQITNTIEGVLIAITCVVVIGIAIAVYNLAETNREGVHRIVDCTTQGHDCYEEQQSRTNQLVAQFIVQLQEGHLALECIINIPMQNRDAATLAACREKARVETERVLNELQTKFNALAEEARKKNGGD